MLLYLIFRIANIIIGIGCLWYGFTIFKEGWSHLYGYSIPPANGIFVAFFGLILIFYGIFKKSKTAEIDKNEILICPVCRKIYNTQDAPQLKCPECENDLEKKKNLQEPHP